MTMFTRRTLVQSTLATGALAGSGLLEWAKAWAQAAPWKPEKGAQLSLLRWKYFVQSEDDAFMALLDAFTKATGVKVTIARESFEDIRPRPPGARTPKPGPACPRAQHRCRISSRQSGSTAQHIGADQAKNT